MDIDGCLSNLEQNTDVTFYTGIDEPSLLSPLMSLQSLPHLDPNYVENYLNDEGGKALDVGQIKEFSQAIDAYFASTHNTDVTGPLSIEASPSTSQSSPSSSCFNKCCNTCNPSCNSPCNIHFNSPRNSSRYSSSTQLKHLSNFNPDYRHVRIACPKFKSKLTLADDITKVKEPWIPHVAKQILSSVAVQEVAQAFKTTAFVNPHNDIGFIESNFFSDPTPPELVSTCEKIRAYRKLPTDDKVTLIKSAFLDFNALKGVIVFDPEVDGWFYGGKVWSRKWFYEINPAQTRRLDHIIETFPNLLRNDLKAIALLYTIVLFNPDLVKLKFRNTVRLERYTYTYLLKRYLTAYFGSECEVSDTLYRLMVKIDEIVKLRRGTVKIFDSYQPGCSTIMTNHVAHLVQFKSL
uniref:NR LBD domain-containing protein n=1 Tax=Tetranychus urticae TaxID=32264 RepID=T1JRV3_TETUR